MTGVIEPMRDGELESVIALLRESRLPLDGLDQAARIVVARDGAQIVGTAALEMYRDGALLRSIAVAAHVQGRGLGRELTEAALRVARDAGAPAAFLLTTTAERYFPKFGFARIERDEVPTSVRASVEFTTACPSSATVMRKIL
jgi:amino-acid N-acetyltransferase